jgi:hypothetical protein
MLVAESWKSTTGFLGEFLISQKKNNYRNVRHMMMEYDWIENLTGRQPYLKIIFLHWHTSGFCGRFTFAQYFNQ